jgi:hypothetical protein
MQTNLLWTGREYYSLENCLVNIRAMAADITATIVGKYGGTLYKVDYRIRTNQQWETTFLEIHARHHDLMQDILLEGDGKGHWIFNSKPAPEFNGCIDVDIPLTPFTNTLPIRRLKLGKNQSKEIHVIYCDLLEQRVRPVQQKYTCLSKTRYHYENIPNDFEATIEVDKDGLVEDYPELFERTARIDSHYKVE